MSESIPEQSSVPMFSHPSEKPLPNIPVEVLNLVEIYPNWRTKFRCFVDDDNWPEFRPWFDRLKRYYGHDNIGHSLLGHTTEPREGVRFGSEDPRIEQTLFTIFDPQSRPPAPAPSSETEAPSPEVHTLSHEDLPPPSSSPPTKKPASHLLDISQIPKVPRLPVKPTRPARTGGRSPSYPWHRLQKPGDYFLVKTDRPNKNVSVMVSQRMARHPDDRRILRCVEVPEGSMVILLWAPGCVYENICEDN